MEMEVLQMRKIKKIDAFSLVVRTMEKGDEKNANKMFSIVINAILQNKDSSSNSQYITIKEKDIGLFKELLGNGIDD